MTTPAPAPVMVPILENIFGITTDCGDGVDVRALLICGRHVSLLIDTLLRPSDLTLVREFVEARDSPLLLANSHADWDHWWGNAAFPDAPVFGHVLTQRRQHKEGARSLATQRRSDPQKFAEVVLRPVTVAFDGRLELDLGGLHVEFSLLPGHTHDCTVAYIRERRLLFAADAAEDPIPLLNEGAVGDWPDRLRAWAERVRLVIPAHGAIAGPELLRRNAAYLETLTRDPALAPTGLREALPFYRRAHRRNVKKAGA